MIPKYAAVINDLTSHFGRNFFASALSLTLYLSVSPALAANQDAPPQRLALLPPQAPSDLAPMLAEGVREAFAEGGAELLSEADTTSKLKDASARTECSEKGCFTYLGSVLNVPYLVFASAHVGQDSAVALRLEIRDAVSEKVVAEDEVTFSSDFSAPKPRAYARAKVLYSAFLRATTKYVAAPPVVYAAEPDVVEPRDKTSASWHRPAVLGGAAVGVAAIVLGSYLWSINGDTSKTEQTPEGIVRDRYTTKTLGQVAVAGGVGVLIASGALWLYTRGNKAQSSSKVPIVGINVLPGAVSLQGSF